MCCDEEQEGCQRPENLTGDPEDCTPDEIRECHGDDDAHPCVEPEVCEHSERLKGKPGECSPDQIRECHGNAAGHKWNPK